MYAKHSVVLGKYHELVLAPDGYDPYFGAYVAVMCYENTDDGFFVPNEPKIRMDLSIRGQVDVSRIEEWAEVLDAAALIARGQDLPEWRLPANVLAEWEKARAAMNGA